jgi:hypothetical protein
VGYRHGGSLPENSPPNYKLHPEIWKGLLEERNLTLIAIGVSLTVLIVLLAIGGAALRWTGFGDKTFWDWLQLLSPTNTKAWSIGVPARRSLRYFLHDPPSRRAAHLGDTSPKWAIRPAVLLGLSLTAGWA